MRAVLGEVREGGTVPRSAEDMRPMLQRSRMTDIGGRMADDAGDVSQPLWFMN